MGNKVSVIIPVYNGEKFIAQTINSVFAQNHLNLEIIVIDDGSTDGTHDVLRPFKNKIIYKKIRNQGVSNARNVGLREASGDLIAFLDSDDIWMKGKLSKQIKNMSEYPQIKFSCSDFLVKMPTNISYNHFHDLSIAKKLHFDAPLNISPLSLLLDANFVGTSSVLITKDLAEKVGFFNTNYRVAEDYDYWLRCAMVTNFIVTSEILYEKNQHAENISNDKLRLCLSSQKVLLKLLTENAAYLEKQKLIQKCKFKIAQTYYRAGNLFFENGENKKAFDCYWSGCFLGGFNVRNLAKFFGVFFRKVIRLLSFGLLSRKKLKTFKKLSRNK